MPIGIGPIQDHYSNALLAGGFHNQVKGADIRVEPNPNILNIENEDIDAFQVEQERLLLFAIEGNNLYPGDSIDTVIDVCSGLFCTSEAMFGRKKGHHIDVTADQAIDQMSLSDGAGMIDDQANGLVFQEREVIIGTPRPRLDFRL